MNCDWNCRLAPPISIVQLFRFGRMSMNVTPLNKIIRTGYRALISIAPKHTFRRVLVGTLNWLKCCDRSTGFTAHEFTHVWTRTKRKTELKQNLRDCRVRAEPWHFKRSRYVWINQNAFGYVKRNHCEPQRVSRTIMWMWATFTHFCAFVHVFSCTPEMGGRERAFSLCAVTT